MSFLSFAQKICCSGILLVVIFASFAFAQNTAPPTGTTTGEVAIDAAYPYPGIPRYSQGYPSYAYFTESLVQLNSGNFEDAKKSLGRDLRMAMKIGGRNGSEPWIDSICYFAQSGECDFQLGRYDEALRGYRNAVELYLQYIDWLLYVDFSGQIQPRQKSRIWGTPLRSTEMVDFSRNGFTIKMSAGLTAMASSSIPQGTGGTFLVEQSAMQTINAPEIVRSIALAIRRMGEILGPIAPFDATLLNLAASLTQRPALPSKFAATWVGTIEGLTLTALGQDAGAQQLLSQNISLDAFDHNLTGYALEAQAKLALRNNRPAEAMSLFLETSYHAASYRDMILLADSFRNAAAVARFLQPSQAVPFIGPATIFYRQRSEMNPLVTTTLLLESAEDILATRGELRQVDDLLKEASATATKSMATAGQLTSHHDYLRAWVGYALAWNNHLAGKSSKIQEANQAFNNSMKIEQRRSLWLHQLSMLSARFHRRDFSDNNLSSRHAMNLYAQLLREPTATDWGLNPRESLAVTMSLNSAPFEEWFSLAMQRSQPETALEISERARQQRFFSSLPGGPSLFSLRLLTGAQEETLTDEMRQQRQRFSLDVGPFAELSAKVRQIEQSLVSIPAVPPTQELREKQRELLTQLEQLSAAQEIMLRLVALSRLPMMQTFPPLLRLEQVRDSMHESMAMLIFFDCAGDLYGFLLTKTGLESWQVITSAPQQKTLTLRELINNYLESLGLSGARELKIKEIAGSRWRTTGYDLLQRLLGGERKAAFSELVIVPTTLLWYVPFESMCLKIGDNLMPLISATETPLAIRYSPTMALGLPPKTARLKNQTPVIIYGKLAPKDSEDVSANALDRYRKAGLTQMAAISADPKNEQRYFPLPASAATWVTQINQLIVLDDLNLRSDKGAYGWSPITCDKDLAKNPLGTWFQLPWGAPSLIMLPSYTTGAEAGLKANSGQAGDDIFLPAMALMSMGSRTILLSRWRTAGRSAYDLVGAFLDELTRSSAAEAWRNAILEVGAGELNLAEEPRIREAKNTEPVSATHPFFWSGTILIDRGDRAEVKQP